MDSNKIKTYRLTVLLPVLISGCFLALLIIYSWFNYSNQVNHIYRNSYAELKSISSQTAHSIQYALAKRDDNEVRRQIATFSLNDKAEYSVLLDDEMVIDSASAFAWKDQPASKVINHADLNIISQAINQNAMVVKTMDKAIISAIPLIDNSERLTGSTKIKYLVLKFNLEPVLNHALKIPISQALPAVFVLAILSLILISVIRKTVIKPLQALQGLARQIENGKQQPENPLYGNNEQFQVGEALVEAGIKIQSQIDELTEREQRLSITLNSIGDSVIVTDSTGRISRMNKTASELTGWSEQDAIGKELTTVFDIYHAVTGEKLASPVQEVLTSKQIIGLTNHTLLISKTGERFHISDSAAPIRISSDQDAPILGVILVFQDVTYQYKLREDLHKNASFLKNLLSISPGVTYVLDIHYQPETHFSLSYVSDSVEHFTGHNAEYWLTDPFMWISHIHPDDMTDVKKSLTTAIRTKEPAINEFRFKHHLGHYINVRDHLTIQSDKNGIATQVVGVALDITKEKYTFEKQQFLGELIERSLTEIYIFDAISLRFIEVNKGARDNLGYSIDELNQKHAYDIKPELSEHDFRTIITPLIEGETDRLIFESKHQRKNGSEYPVSVDLQMDMLGSEQVLIAFVDDISEKLKTEKALQIAGKVFKSNIEGIMVTDAENHIIQVNPAFCSMTGYSEHEVLGKNPSILKSGRHGPEFYKQIWQKLETVGSWSGEIWNKRKNGEVFPLWQSISTVKNEQNQIQQYIALMSDISESIENQQQISFLAHHDVLTNLPNRILLADRMHQALLTAERRGHSLALLFLDLDRFKFINDSLGHAFGDKLLVEVAKRLLAQVREQDTVARTGGDEFTVLLQETDADGAAHVANKLIESISQPFDIDDHELFITLSIGISMFPENGTTMETLNKNADTAMYRAKQGGRNQYHFYTEEMHSQMLFKLEIEHALRNALERNQFELVYQPQIDIISQKVIGCEALLRWQHPEKGYISPLDFIPIAEETGMINNIGDWVIKTATRQLAKWIENGYADLVMAVNLSGLQFNNQDLVNNIKTILQQNQVPTKNLELEITESIAMEDINLTIHQLNLLSKAGIQLSLDDFGTGYSSLNYLKKFPFNKLKIDQSFIFDMLQDADDEAIVNAIITLAKSLGLKTLAEGVENNEQLEALKGRGCDYIQGYLFSKPLSADQFSSYLKQH